MPAKAKDTTNDTAPAVAEVIDPKDSITVTFNDHTYSFKRKRLGSAQFRLRMQKGFNETAIEWLMGPRAFAQFLNDNMDEDGCTTQEVFFDFVDVIGKELGTGNS